MQPNSTPPLTTTQTKAHNLHGFKPITKLQGEHNDTNCTNSQINEHTSQQYQPKTTTRVPQPGDDDFEIQIPPRIPRNKKNAKTNNVNIEDDEPL